MAAVKVCVSALVLFVLIAMMNCSDDEGMKKYEEKVAAITRNPMIQPRGENSESGNEETDKKKSSTATEAPKAPEIPKLPENLPKPQPTEICSACSCNNGTHILDCTEQNLQNHFLAADWTALNDSGFRFVKVLFRNNRIVHLLPFPEIQLTVLDLSHNEIMKIDPKTFKFMQSMVELDLSYNRLRSDFLQPDVFEGQYNPESYEPLRSLRVLRLGNNLLHSLHPDIFEFMPALEELSLDSNPLKVIDRVTEIAISSLPYLKILDLSYTELTSLPDYLLHTPKYLTTLNLTGNMLIELPTTLSMAQSLIWLSLDENPIQKIAGNSKFPRIPTLKTLSMCYMGELSTIGEGGLSGLTNLSVLRISNNPHFSYIHPSALSQNIGDLPGEEDWPPISELYLHNNNLSTLDVHLIGRWDNVKPIDIRFNSWSCECENQWLISTLIPMIEEKTPAFIHGLVCHSPIEMKGLNMHELEEKHSKMRCADIFGNRPERDGALLIGILVGILVAIPLSLGLVLCYKKGCFGVINTQRGPADFSRAFYKRADINDSMHI